MQKIYRYAFTRGATRLWREKRYLDLPSKTTSLVFVSATRVLTQLVIFLFVIPSASFVIPGPISFVIPGPISFVIPGPISFVIPGLTRNPDKGMLTQCETESAKN